jgi:hypothetical protein
MSPIGDICEAMGCAGTQALQAVATAQRFEHIANFLLWRCFDISAIVITSAAT